MAVEKKEEGPIVLGGREAKTQDATCRVRLYISGTDEKKKNIKNNITSTLYVPKSKVSEVTAKIMAAFGAKTK